jgi:hypothetical protein
MATARVVVVRVVGEDGRPVRAAAVHGRLPFPPAYSALERTDFNAITDQEGLAVIKDVPADAPVVVELRPAGMVPAQSPVLFPIRQPAPEGLVAVAETVTVSAGRSLRVLVEAEGRPVQGAAVNLLPLVEPRLDFGGHASRDTTRGSIRGAVTDAAGAAAFDALPANPITCEVRAPGMLTQLLVVEAPKTGSKPVRVKLLPDPDPPGKDVPWRTSIDAATEEARRVGRPVFLVMTMDGERANDWMAGHHYHDPEVVRVAREVVPILSSAFGEGGVGADPGHVEVGGKCARYGTIPCRFHQQIELVARTSLMGTRTEFEVPRHLAATPAGEPIFHRVFYLSERDLVRLVVRALRVVAPEPALRLARERLSPVLDDLLHADGGVRKRGAAALALLASSGDEHAAALVQNLPALGLLPATRAEIAGALHPSGLTSPGLTLAALLQDPEPDVRRALFQRMGEIAGVEDVLDRLASELSRPDPQAREVLLRALGVERRGEELRVPAPATGNRWRIVEELVDQPESPRIQGLDDVLRDVALYGRNRIFRALGRRAAADPGAQELLIRAAKGPNAVVALRAIARAASQAKPQSPLVKALVEAALGSEDLAREEALRGLASLTVPVDPEVPMASLAHPSRAVRIQAALALWRRGNRAGEAVLFAATGDLELGDEVRAALRN